VAVYVPI